MLGTTPNAARGRGEGSGDYGGGGRGAPGNDAPPPIQHCSKCDGNHRPNKRCWDPCPWCHQVHHHSTPCNGPRSQPPVPHSALGPVGPSPQENFAYHIGRGMASQMAGGAGFDLSSIMAAADSLSPALPAMVPPLSIVAPSHPSVATSQRGLFAPAAAKAQGVSPASSSSALGNAPAKAGGSRTHRGSQGKRKRTRALEKAERYGVTTKVKQEEEEGSMPLLKKIRAEEEEAAAAGDDHETKNRRERRSALAIENAALRQLLQYVPEDVLQLARQAQEADANAAAAYFVEEQAHQAPKADGNATATSVAEEQTLKGLEADTKTTAERKPVAHVAEE